MDESARCHTRQRLDPSVRAVGGPSISQLRDQIAYLEIGRHEAGHTDQETEKVQRHRGDPLPHLHGRKAYHSPLLRARSLYGVQPLVEEMPILRDAHRHRLDSNFVLVFFINKI